ncbi:MAG: glycosyltransferase family 39 protein, partial [Deltaproteobacteria bacterium]|nr:glycosyltransferase family 39 protein [Deltaproteobacteria bacterium]
MEPAARPVDRWDGATAGALALVALAARLVAAREYDIDVATGPDSPLWGLSALDWQVGNKVYVPPLFPALAGLAAWAGVGVADGGRLVSLVAGSVATAVVYAGARVLGLSRLAALLGGALVVVHPDLVAESLIFQPEAVTAAVLGAVGAGALLHATRRSVASFLAYAVAVGVAATAREHGLALLLPALLFAVLFPPRVAWARAWAPLALFGLVSLAPVLGRSSPLVLPTEWPWADKAAVVKRDLDALEQGLQPAYLNMNVDSYPAGDTVEAQAVSNAYPCAILLPAEERPRALLALHWRRARALGHDLHAWLLGGLLGGGLLGWRRRNWAVAAALPSLLVVIVPAFVVWSQRRHAVVLLPASFLGVV